MPANLWRGTLGSSRPAAEWKPPEYVGVFQKGEIVGRMKFRILKFKPGTGRVALLHYDRRGHRGRRVGAAGSQQPRWFAGIIHELLPLPLGEGRGEGMIGVTHQEATTH